MVGGRINYQQTYSTIIGFSIMFTIHFGVPLFLETPIYLGRLFHLRSTAGSSAFLLLCTLTIFVKARANRAGQWFGRNDVHLRGLVKTHEFTKLANCSNLWFFPWLQCLGRTLMMMMMMVMMMMMLLLLLLRWRLGCSSCIFVLEVRHWGCPRQCYPVMLLPTSLRI